jgi:predicted nucleotidyltransferase
MENIIVLMPFGSHLYGTSTTESDNDYKGIYLPTKKDCYLKKFEDVITENSNPNKKNTKDDIDKDIYSLQYFMKSALAGKKYIIDMIHCPDNTVIQTSSIWKEIRAQRHKFYTKKLFNVSFYLTEQTAKYQRKMYRLKTLLELKQTFQGKGYLKDLWETLPLNEYCTFFNTGDVIYYSIFGKKLMKIDTLSSARSVVDRILSTYGSTIYETLQDGVNWKTLSHTFRVGYQVIEIYKTGDLIYPLKAASFLRDLKQKKLDYIEDKISDKVKEMLSELHTLEKGQNYPEKMDEEWINQIILRQYDIFE